MMEKKLKIESNIKRNVPLAPLTAFRIGGRASYFCEIRTLEEAKQAVLWAKRKKLPFFVLGGGSNVLVADNGYEGLVVKMENAKILPTGQAGRPTRQAGPPTRQAGKIQNSKRKIICESGVLLSSLVSRAFQNGLTGLEWGIGIPGTVGGAIAGNAGAFGTSMEDIVKSVKVLDVKTGKTKFLKKQDCRFGYRESIFGRKKNFIILSAQLQFRKGDKEKIKEKMKECLNYRKATQPLNHFSAGSVFRNYRRAIKDKRALREFPRLAEFSKKNFVPAGFLIEKAGLKGLSRGRAKVSEKHANFIVNLGGAKARDVIKLHEIINKKIKEKFKVVLELENQLLGF